MGASEFSNRSIDVSMAILVNIAKAIADIKIINYRSEPIFKNLDDSYSRTS